MKGGELAGEIIRLDKAFSVSYDNLNNSNMKTDFTLVPLNGKIKLEYVDGIYDNLNVYLYDTRYEEYIQCGTIDGEGKHITFSNLSGSYSYYIEVEFAGTSEANTLVLGFSG